MKILILFLSYESILSLVEIFFRFRQLIYILQFTIAWKINFPKDVVILKDYSFPEIKFTFSTWNLYAKITIINRKVYIFSIYAICPSLYKYSDTDHWISWPWSSFLPKRRKSNFKIGQLILPTVEKLLLAISHAINIDNLVLNNIQSPTASSLFY